MKGLAKNDEEQSHTKYEVVKTCIRQKLINEKSFGAFVTETEKSN